MRAFFTASSFRKILIFSKFRIRGVATRSRYTSFERKLKFSQKYYAVVCFIWQMSMYIKVKVHADEKKEQIIKKNPDTFEIWVKAPASQGRANIAVINLLAKTLGIEAKLFKLVKGATSPSKIFEIRS